MDEKERKQELILINDEMQHVGNLKTQAVNHNNEIKTQIKQLITKNAMLGKYYFKIIESLNFIEINDINKAREFTESLEGPFGSYFSLNEKGYIKKEAAETKTQRQIRQQIYDARTSYSDLQELTEKYIKLERRRQRLLTDLGRKTEIQPSQDEDGNPILIPNEHEKETDEIQIKKYKIKLKILKQKHEELKEKEKKTKQEYRNTISDSIDLFPFLKPRPKEKRPELLALEVMSMYHSAKKIGETTDPRFTRLYTAAKNHVYAFQERITQGALIEKIQYKKQELEDKHGLLPYKEIKLPRPFKRFYHK